MGMNEYAHGNPILTVNFSPDNSKVISGSPDKVIRVWNIGSGADEGDGNGAVVDATQEQK